MRDRWKGKKYSEEETEEWLERCRTILQGYPEDHIERKKYSEILLHHKLRREKKLDCSN